MNKKIIALLLFCVGAIISVLAMQKPDVAGNGKNWIMLVAAIAFVGGAALLLFGSSSKK
jgi:H+/Cl- antiporter ClcA